MVPRQHVSQQASWFQPSMSRKIMVPYQNYPRRPRGFTLLCRDRLCCHVSTLRGKSRGFTPWCRKRSWCHARTSRGYPYGFTPCRDISWCHASTSGGKLRGFTYWRHEMYCQNRKSRPHAARNFLNPAKAAKGVFFSPNSVGKRLKTLEKESVGFRALPKVPRPYPRPKKAGINNSLIYSSWTNLVF